MAFDQAISLCVGFEVIRGFDESDISLRCEVGGDSGTEFGMRVDTGPDSGASGGQFEHGVECSSGPFGREDQLSCQASDFLPQTQRCRIGQVSAADLDHLVPLVGLVLQRVGEPLECRDELVADPFGDRDMDRGGEHVVGALPHVDMVIGVDRFLGSKPVALNQFDCTVGDDLVDVHVARGARAGLEDVDGELVIEFSVDDFLAGGHQGLDLGLVERRFAAVGQFAEVTVGDGRGQFDSAESVHQFGGKFPATDRKVVDGSLGLCSVVGLSGDLDVAHRVVFGAEFCHRGGQSENGGGVWPARSMIA